MRCSVTNNLCPLTGALIACAIQLILIMHIFASVTKTTDGRESTWRFCQDGDKYFALRVTPEVKVVACQSVNDLRGLYKKYVTDKRYGFTNVPA